MCEALRRQQPGGAQLLLNAGQNRSILPWYQRVLLKPSGCLIQCLLAVAGQGPGDNGRTRMSVNVSERVQHELYFEPFRGAVDGGAGAIMVSSIWYSTAAWSLLGARNQADLMRVPDPFCAFAVLVQSHWKCLCLREQTHSFHGTQGATRVPRLRKYLGIILNHTQLIARC